MICQEQHRLLLQFHITGRCNLRCKHCYRIEGDIEPLSFEDIKNVIQQYRSLRERYNQNHGIGNKGHINITGGEPFIRSDIKEIIAYLGTYKHEFSFGILSNGSFLNEEMIALLKENQVSFVQLSLDGDQNTHDALRANGDYYRVLDAAKKLEEHGIRTYISFTANKENYKYLPLVAKECRKRHITKLWSDRLVPIGSGEELFELAITSSELPDYLMSMKKAQGNTLDRMLYPKTTVTMNRALQFMNSDGAIYSCSAGNSLITVDEMGQIMPCRRMPIICGDIFSSTLEKVYYHNEIFEQLRKPAIPKECAKCSYQEMCRGGARCQSYAVYKNFHRADPGCPKKQQIENT